MKNTLEKVERLVERQCNFVPWNGFLQKSGTILQTGFQQVAELICEKPDFWWNGFLERCGTEGGIYDLPSVRSVPRILKSGTVERFAAKTPSTRHHD